MMVFGNLGYILLIASAGTRLEVVALPVAGAPMLTTIIAAFQVRTLFAACKSVLLQINHACWQLAALQCKGAILLWHQLLKPCQIWFETACHKCLCRTARHHRLVITLHVVCSLIPELVARKSSDFSSTLPAGSEQCITWLSCRQGRLSLLTTFLSVTAHIQVSLWHGSSVAHMSFLQVLWLWSVCYMHHVLTVMQTVVLLIKSFMSAYSSAHW